ncbi:prenyltransferase/squalene oxidase repeat-containing protein [Nocardioides sp.]|uniref:prenyltransferase/squalene oxidase repeat-containing protein n=1 Tax=Nocardioides sp. TaxID=35761 RepID=UPI0039E40E0E
MHIASKRIAAVLVGGTLATSAVTVGSAHAVAPGATTPATPAAEAAANWLGAKAASQEGGLLGSYYDGTFYTNVGATIDFGIGLVETGAASSTLTAVSSAVEAGIADYVGDGTTSSYAGQLAKASVFLQSTGEDPADFDGTDLIERLEDRVQASGRIEDLSAYGDYANAISQTFAVAALETAGSAKAEAATDFLLGLQCADGGFWSASFSGTDVSCDSGDASSVDATAYAVHALLSQESDPDIATALDEAVDYLKAAQSTDGGFTDGTAVNANSTGLAGWALGSAGETAAAATAAEWVAAHQVLALTACGASKLDGDAGAIAYSDEVLATGQADGITEATTGSWQVAGAQALAALAYLPTSAATLTGPTGFVEAGTAVTLTAAGLRATEKGCLSGAGAAKALTGPGELTATLPAATGDYTFTLATVGTPVTTTVKALGAADLGVKAKKKIKVKKKLTVTASGLAAGEQVTVTFRGKQVATGVAAADGTFKATFKVTKKLAKKAKKGKIVVAGQFADRSGKTSVKIKR